MCNFILSFVLIITLTTSNIKADIEEPWKPAENYTRLANIERNKTVVVNRAMTEHKNNGSFKQLNIFHMLTIDKALNDLIRDYWRIFCKARFRFISGSNFTAHWAVVLSCDLEGEHNWSLQSYRIWILQNEKSLQQLIRLDTDLRVAVRIRCADQYSTVSLPWPAKAKYLWYVSVDNCKIVDFMKEYNQTEPHGDYLKVYVVTNCKLETHVHQFLQLLINYNNRSRQFDCGGTEIEKYVFRNVSKTFSGITEMSARVPTETEVMDTFAKVGQNNLKSNYACNFKYLRYVDESMSSIVSKHRWHFLTEHGKLPSLEYYNLSHSRIREMSIYFLEWRRYFPKLKHLDLSFNKIKYFSGITDNGLSTDPIGVIDLRHNNITSLSKDDIYTLKFQSQTVFIDIRDNPIICDCKLSGLVNTMKNSTSILLQKYKYMLDLKCAKPPALLGKKISQLGKEHCEFIEVFSLVVPVIILACCLLLLAVILFVTIKYRQEIMILAFTRLHISLPCREVINADREYDAFICYSEQDMNWVIYTLLPGLEEPNNGPTFKLCIHHRDFPVGGTIFDNIDSKVKESRHTVLVLSNNFLRSTWCRCEFWAAFTESLTQKKQHLIMIILEDLDGALMEPTLKRCLKTFTYVRLDDRLFWDKIIYALSDKKKNKDTENDRNRGANDEEHIVPNYKRDEMNNRENAGGIIEILDGMNNNRDVLVELRADRGRDQQLDVNNEQRDGRINIDDFNLHNIRNEQLAVDQNVNPQILHFNNGVVQDGEWVL